MLTDALVNRLQPCDKQFKLTEQQGLFLLVKPNGSKLWRFKYFLDAVNDS